MDRKEQLAQCHNKAANHQLDKGILRRKFVPITFTISRENQCINAGAKLPFTTAKIKGVLTATDIAVQTNIEPIARSYYAGVVPFEITDDRFLNLSEAVQYTSAYPPDVLLTYEFTGDDEPYWYFACPATDIVPFFLQNTEIARLDEFTEVMVRSDTNSEPLMYYLWSRPYEFEGIITFEQFEL